MLNTQNLSLYEKIKNDLIKKINLGFYPEDARLPSENQLTQIYSVSRITATKALTELAREGYIYRVQGKGSYVMAKSKRPDILIDDSAELCEIDTIKKIGVIIPENSDSHSAEIIKGITTMLTFPEYFCSIAITRHPQLENFSINYFKNNGYDGIIFFPMDTEFYNKTILELHINEYPLVLIDRILPGINLNFVTCDNTVGIQLAIDELVALGHANIAFISCSCAAELTTAHRHKAFITALQNNKLTKQSYPFSYFEIAKDYSFREKFVQLVLNNEISAVITGNAYSSTLLHQICSESNIRVPQDLSIVSFDRPDNSELTFSYVQQNSYDIGKESAQIMMHLVSDKIEKKQHRHAFLTPTFVKGQSTAPFTK